MMRFARRAPLQLLGCALLLGLIVLPTPAAAAEGDEEGRARVEAGYTLMGEGQHEDALTELKQAIKTCNKLGCEDAVRGAIYLAEAVAYGNVKNKPDARLAFEYALHYNRNAQYDKKLENETVKAAFEDAKKALDEGKARKPPPPPGQLDPLAQVLFETAQSAFKAVQSVSNKRIEEECIGSMVALDTPFPKGKLLLARCQEMIGQLIEARKDANEALKMAEAQGNDALTAEVKEYLERLGTEIPKIVIKLPRGVRDPEIKVDGRKIPPDELSAPILHNPGKVKVNAIGVRGNSPFKCELEEAFEKQETITIDTNDASQCPPCPGPPNGPASCCFIFKDKDLREKCLNPPKEGADVVGGFEVFTYHDTDNINVLEPEAFFAVSDPTAGWNFGGSGAIDLVTQASTDIIATASRKFDDQRGQLGVSGGYRIGPVRAGVNAGFSYESDYFARSVGLELSGDVLDKMVSPYFSYGFGHDWLGRAETPWSVFRRTLMRHTFNFGGSAIIDKETVFVLAGTVQLEFGDASKPYRHVMMFEPAEVSQLEVGASPESVAWRRLPMMPLEQLPADGRQRYALLARIMHRLETSTIRFAERLYIDSWGQMGSSTDGRLLYDVNEDLRITPHIRFHIQGPVDFWQRAYTAQMCTPVAAVTDPCVDANGAATTDGFGIPRLRTTDRELGPLLTGTVGLGVRYAISHHLALHTQVEAAYNRYLDHLFMAQRLGVFTTTGMEFEL